MLFDKITIIGIGLIGSSLARVIMKKGLAGKLCACDKNKEYLAEARELGIVDEISEDLGKASKMPIWLFMQRRLVHTARLPDRSFRI